MSPKPGSEPIDGPARPPRVHATFVPAEVGSPELRQMLANAATFGLSEEAQARIAMALSKRRETELLSDSYTPNRPYAHLPTIALINRARSTGMLRDERRALGNELLYRQHYETFKLVTKDGRWTVKEEPGVGYLLEFRAFATHGNDALRNEQLLIDEASGPEWPAGSDDISADDVQHAFENLPRTPARPATSDNTVQTSFSTYISPAPEPIFTSEEERREDKRTALVAAARIAASRQFHDFKNAAAITTALADDFMEWLTADK